MSRNLPVSDTPPRTPKGLAHPHLQDQRHRSSVGSIRGGGSHDLDPRVFFGNILPQKKNIRTLEDFGAIKDKPGFLIPLSFVHGTACRGGWCVRFCWGGREIFGKPWGTIMPVGAFRRAKDPMNPTAACPSTGPRTELIHGPFTHAVNRVFPRPKGERPCFICMSVQARVDFLPSIDWRKWSVA